MPGHPHTYSYRLKHWKFLLRLPEHSQNEKRFGIQGQRMVGLPLAPRSWVAVML